MPNSYPTIDPKQLVAYGKIRRTHGNQGEVSIALASPALEELDPEYLFLLIDEIPVPYKVSNIRGGGEQFIVGFEGVEDLSEAELLVGLQVQIYQDELPEDSNNLPITLNGYELRHLNGDTIGVIMDVDTSTINILILIERPDHTNSTIPLVEQWIEAIDNERRTITMDFPLELLDL